MTKGLWFKSYLVRDKQNTQKVVCTSTPFYFMFPLSSMYQVRSFKLVDDIRVYESDRPGGKVAR